jgi:hypothetical protein
MHACILGEGLHLSTLEELERIFVDSGWPDKEPYSHFSAS